MATTAHSSFDQRVPGALHGFLRRPSGTRGHNARHHEESTTQDAFGDEVSAFSGEEMQVPLIGELDVVTGATVSLVDNF